MIAVPWGRLDAGTFVPQQHGDGLELRAHGRRHAATLNSRLHLADGSGEHRDDVALVADVSLLRRGGTASALLALACSSQKNSSYGMPGTWPRQHATQSDGRGAECPGQETCRCGRRADLRISADRRN